MAAKREAPGGQAGGESNGAGQDHVGYEASTERPPPSSQYGQTLDRIEDDLDHLIRAFNQLRPAFERPGPVRMIATAIAWAVMGLNWRKRGIESENEL